MDDELEEELMQGGAMASADSKIDLVTGILIMLSMIVLDLLEIVPFVGDFTSIIAFGVNFYLKQIGVNGVLFAVSNTLDFIPFLQEFPCKSIGWALTWGIEALGPKAVTEALEKAGELAQGKTGAAGGTAAAIGTTEQTASGASRIQAFREEIGEIRTATQEISNESDEQRGDKGLSDLMRSGAEISPEEEAMEAAFNPEEARFREAEQIDKGPSEGKRAA